MERRSRFIRYDCLALSFLFVLQVARPAGGSPSDDSPYIGSRQCAQCHQEKAEQHARSPHGLTWRPVSVLDQIKELPQEVRERDGIFAVRKVDQRWSYVVSFADRPAQVIPIHSIIGGSRFGISFILQAEELEGRKLARPALVEARYMLGSENGRLKLSPGFPTLERHTYETALGRIMSPMFADKCLGCHGGPVDPELARQGGPTPPFLDTGVTCEKCHGPGQPHLEAVANGEADLRIRHPGKLPKGELMAICQECHDGFFPLLQPRPGDVLIATQFTALVRSECYIQSRGELTCISCHDPHRAARPDEPAYEASCLGCHHPEGGKDAVCPVDSQRGCVGCHMPENEQPGHFRLRDHWIRVVR